MSSGKQRSTLVIANIHCPSCVSTIESVLAGFPYEHEVSPASSRASFDKLINVIRPSTPIANRAPAGYEALLGALPAFTDVRVSIVNGTVTFSHASHMSLKPVVHELEDAGFEVIQSAAPDLEKNNTRHLHPSTASSSSWSRFTGLFTSPRKREQAHRDNCAACRGEEEDLEDDLGGFSPTLDLAGRNSDVLRDMYDEQSEDSVEALMSIDGMTCSSCTSALESALDPEKLPGIISVQVILVDNSARVVYNPGRLSEAKIIEAIEDLGYDAKVLSSGKIAGSGRHAKKPSRPKQAKRYRLKFSIDGMTCASCVGSISNMLDNLEGVQHFDIDLMGGSATIEVGSKDLGQTIASEIEDLGYECRLLEVQGISKQIKNSQVTEGNTASDLVGRERTLDIRIDGFFCEHCPEKTNRLLQNLNERFDIFYTPSSLESPVSTLTYTANAPHFTLRTIRTAIAELGFTMTIIKPETLQDRARTAQAKERRRILLRLVVCGLFCVPTFLIGMVFASLLPEDNEMRKFFMHPIWGGASRMTVALFCLATPVQFGVGLVFYERAYKSLRGVWRTRRGEVSQRKIWADRLLRWGSMDTLVALGTTIAYLSSLAYMILDILGMGTGEMAYFDTSVFLITFILAGRYLESVSKARTSDAILELGKLRPKKGLLYYEGKSPEEVESEYIDIGDRLLVPVGASPPVDGRLDEASSITSFDEASLTGESRPAAKRRGDEVFAGTYNAGPSAAIVVVQKRDGETVIDNIAIGVREAMSKKASIERLADSVTAVFVPAIVGISCLTFAIWMLRAYTGHLPEEWLDRPGAGGWVLFAMQFTVSCLVVACPCGIGLAAPTAQLVGVGLAARCGIMPNGGAEAFQSFTNIDAIAFDKTGTLTMGKFQVSDHRTAGSENEQLLWTIAAAVEQTSNHPIAIAVHTFAQDRLAGIKARPSAKVTSIEEIPGRGMLGEVQMEGATSYSVLVGNEKLLQDKGCLIEARHAGLLQGWQCGGKSVVLVALRKIKALDDKDGNFHVAALLGVADPLRPEASYVLDYFKDRGIDIYIVSGDGPDTVKAVARTLNLPGDHVIGGALPEDKRTFVEDLQNQAKRVRGWNGRSKTRQKLVAFVGDGINDSIALAQADVSIAQGGGSQAATSTADFALLNESLLSIITLQAIARATYYKIISNFIWASVYNIVLIPLAAGAFYDLGQTTLPAVWASLAMALSSVSVVVNSLLLRWTFRVPKEVTRFRDQC